MTLITPVKLNIADKLEKDKKFRKRFFRGQAQDKIAMNIRELRKKRQKRQADLAKEANMMQSAVSRIEQADYSGWSFNTLFRVADALEARLTVSFEPVENVIDWYRKREAVATTEASKLANIQIGVSKITNIQVTEDFSGTITNASVIPFSEIANNQACRQTNHSRLIGAQC